MNTVAARALCRTQSETKSTWNKATLNLLIYRQTEENLHFGE